MITIIVPDLHNNIAWIEPFLSQIESQVDEVVFLGDYFDNFHDGPVEARNTAKWLKNSLKQSKRVHLWGNHDMPYWLPHNLFLRCPGFDHNKCRVINSIISRDEWTHLKLAHYTQGFVLSHAGFSPFSLGGNRESDLTWEIIEIQCKEALEKCNLSLYHPLIEQGARMGNRKPGGCTWEDWGYLWPIKNINQIVGHSPANDVRIRYVPNAADPTSRTYCMDVNSPNERFVFCYGIIKDGNFSIEEFSITA